MSNIRDFYLPVRFNRQKISASSSQTIFNLTTVTIPNGDAERVVVVINGQEQPEDAYTVNSPTQVTLSESMEGGESVVFTVPQLG